MNVSCETRTTCPSPKCESKCSLYLPGYASAPEEAALHELIKTARAACPDQAIHSFLRSPLDVQLPLHISLSAPLVLDTAQREPFTAAIHAAILRGDVRAFTVSPASAEWVSNADATRWFLVLKLEGGSAEGSGAAAYHGQLERLLSACNATARAFGLAELYTAVHEAPQRPAKAGGEGHSAKAGADRGRMRPQPVAYAESVADQATQKPSSGFFHISIAWSLRAPSHVSVSTDTAGKHSSSAAPKPVLQPALRQAAIGFDAVKLKIGNVVVDVALPPPTD